MNESESINEGDMIRVNQAAKLLCVSPRTVWRMIAEGQLTPLRFRRCTRLLRSQVLGCLQAGRKVGAL